MNLVSISLQAIPIGVPLPFALRDEDGSLLANKGFVVSSRDVLEVVRGRGMDFFIDVSESESHQRAYVGKLYDLVRDEKPLGKIADAKITSKDLGGSRAITADDIPDWLDLQAQGHALLRETSPAQFPDRLARLQAQLGRQARRNPDGSLFALMHLSATEIRLYSATHAMLVSVMCGLAAHEVLGWPEQQETTLCMAALTMNIGMTDLQDRMAAQMEAPSAAQRLLVAQHPDHSAELLSRLGVHDANWLGAVRHHHSRTPGPLASRSTALQMARLIQRADMFAARLAPRASRQPTTPAAAMQAAYFDEERQIDEAGAALIKAVGIYSPGSFVRLATGEVGVVVRRGSNTTTPRVAVLINREGMPTGEHTVRDTSVREYRIVASVAHRDVKVQINLNRMLVLTATPGSGRPW